jgi:biopolymer transport protein ExbD
MYMTKKIQYTSGGQALVVLLFYMIVAITLSTTAVAVVLSNSLSVTRNEEGAHALELAEAGAENALIRLMRTTSYTGEVLTINGGSATVTVSGDNNAKIATSSGVVGSFSRTIQVTASMANGVLSVTSWQEL